MRGIKDFLLSTKLDSLCRINKNTMQNICVLNSEKTNDLKI